ncbi:MAG: translation elongation factor P [Bryobacteraceae bacterium]
MVLASQIRTGMAILFENQTYRVVAAEYHPGQGKMGGVAHTRLQNVETGTFRELNLCAELKLQELPVERRALEFLYADGDQCYFMNPETFEQTEIARTVMGPRAAFLEAGMRLGVEFVNGRPVHVVVPDTIEVRIEDTAPAAHQQADSTFKPAKLANGVEVMVPQFVKAGDVIRLDLENMRYMDRARPEAKAKNA